jgi:Histidine kinase-, DNA gyrase B-, and HSP90-like ATPase
MIPLKTIDATPSKRIYHSVIADYDLKLAICELIDNAIDSWHRNGQKNQLEIKINFDDRQKTIKVEDNAGGIKESEIDMIITPGASKTSENDDTIGIFGVGSKRAAVHLSQFIRITSRYKNEKTILVQYDDEWLKLESWSLQIFQIPDITASTTIVELQRLRHDIFKKDFHDLSKHLSYVYSVFLKRNDMKLLVNDIHIKPKEFEDWSYPPECEPQKYVGSLDMDKGVVQYEIVAGLTKSLRELETESNTEYGVYFYCNNRLIEKAVKSNEVGFVQGKAGSPHPDVQIVRVIVFIRGKSLLMPWNSSKSEINFKHPVFKELQNKIEEVTTRFAKFSRYYSSNGGWPDNVFKYQSGVVKVLSLNKEGVSIKSYLPPLPTTRIKKYDSVIKENNKELAYSKPWVIGLYEAIIAVDSINKLNLSQKNRIILILLDSTLEIGFKEYLAHEIGTYADSRLQTIFGNRSNVHTEVKTHCGTKITLEQWKKIEFYYKIRCELIHKKATSPTPNDDIINNFRELVEKVLKNLFDLDFRYKN